MESGGMKHIQSYPLSDQDIRKILGNDIKILTYPELENLHSADEMFDRKGRCILLMLVDSPTSGHWLCLLRKANAIEYFDPYGEKPDYDIDKDAMMKELNGNQPFLMDLLKSADVPVYYNTYDFQKDKEDVNTCGRHCVVRCLYAPYSLERYKNIIDKSGLTPDAFVSGITYDKLHK
jgi:hypothetical protein